MSDERTRRRRADVLRQSPRPADREESERIFRELRDSAQTGSAPLTPEMPVHSINEKPRRRNPALDTMASEWLSLRSPMHPNPLDHRFGRWFDDAERQPEIFSQFAARMVASATDWLAEYERTSKLVTPIEEPRLRHFDEWAELASRHPTVAEALAEVLERWSTLRSKRQLIARTRDVEAAMERGDITAAKNEFREIEQCADVPPATLEELREAIQNLAKRQAEIDAWRSELASAPTSWKDVVRMHEIWARGRRLSHTPGLPRDWMESISRMLEHLQSLSIEFIARRAADWASLDHLREDVAILSDASRGRESTLDESWIEPLASALIRLLDRAVESVADVDGLRRLAASATRIAAPLPARGGRPVQDALRRIAVIASVWEALQSDDIPSELPDGVVPARFVERLDRARLLADRVAVAENAMSTGKSAVERTAACRDAIVILEEVLAEAPRHTGAHTLLGRATARLETLRLDEWIERWDTVELRGALGAGRTNDPLYASLAEALPVLDELAAMRRNKPVAVDLNAWVAWWIGWRNLEWKLPSRKPDALRMTLDDVGRDTATAIRDAVRDHLDRTTTLEEDRAAEAAVMPVAGDLQLRDEVIALAQRSAIHAAVVAARLAGTVALATLVRDSWGTIERYLPWSSAILAEAFERAWEEADDEALDALRDVALREKTARDNERFRHWLEWLDVERSLLLSATPDRLRRMQSFVQRGGASMAFLVRRLSRLIGKWREDGDDAALVWAYRALAHLEPPLFPGADPLIALTRRSAAASNAIVRVCREAAIVDDAFLRERAAELKAIEDGWKRLDELLVAVPVAPSGESWPGPPPELQRAKTLLGAFHGVLESVARWTRSDLRTMGAECDAVRRLLLRELASYPAAEEFDRVLRRVEPLTRLNALEQYFHDACGRCTSDVAPDVERVDVFADAARFLDAIIDTLQAGLPEAAQTLRVMSEEYWRKIPALAGDLLPSNPTAGLDGLRRRFDELQDNDTLFATAIEILWQEQPSVGISGDFDPDAHRSYLAHYPGVPPASARVRRRFDDFVARAAQSVILLRSRALLPEWLQRYVDNVSRGVSPW